MKKKIIQTIANIIRLIRGEVSTSFLIKRGLKVGKNFSRQGGVRIDTSYCFLIEIGDNVILAPNVTILAHDASLKNVLGVSQIGRVSIGNNVFVGAGSIILQNVNIGDNVIIGAGSIVSKDIPSNSVAAGNPAKIICSIEEFKKRKNKIIKKRPMYDRSYEPININKSSRTKMNKELLNGVGFFECDNFKAKEKDRHYGK